MLMFRYFYITDTNNTIDDAQISQNLSYLNEGQ